MSVRTARVEWNGDFTAGQGTITGGSSAFEAGYSRDSIRQSGPGTSPIEILGASLASCYCGALAAYLSKVDCTTKRICTDAVVHLDPEGHGYNIAKIHLHTQVEASGIDEARLISLAERAKSSCPVALALSATEITLQVELI